MSKPVLFLDIDGVLNSIRSSHALGGYPWDVESGGLDLFDMIAVGLIRRLCREVGAEIVLSSTWRLSDRWKKIGPALDIPIVDRTPNLGGPRGREIETWLKNNPRQVYAIVDDDSDMLLGQQPFFVQTDYREGLRYADYERLREILFPQQAAMAGEGK